MGRLSHFNDTSFIYYSSDITFDMFESIVSEFLTVNLLFNIMFVGGAFFLEMCSALPSLRRLEKSCQFLFSLLLCWLAKLYWQISGLSEMVHVASVCPGLSIVLPAVIPHFGVRIIHTLG